MASSPCSRRSSPRPSTAAGAGRRLAKPWRARFDSRLDIPFRRFGGQRARVSAPARARTRSVAFRYDIIHNISSASASWPSDRPRPRARARAPLRLLAAVKTVSSVLSETVHRRGRSRRTRARAMTSIDVVDLVSSDDDSDGDGSEHFYVARASFGTSTTRRRRGVKRDLKGDEAEDEDEDDTVECDGACARDDEEATTTTSGQKVHHHLYSFDQSYSADGENFTQARGDVGTETYEALARYVKDESRLDDCERRRQGKS